MERHHFQKEILKQFIKDANEGKEDKVKVMIESGLPDMDPLEEVPNDRSKGIMIYHFPSKY
ncbi:hypothetical protein D0466_04510 [Peribacillus glennii]|uniref:Uncharacterized protein n=1 Tax=Peribacillus glennii TaxID=2303991 RepID=A0A372LFU1_9BACI|nr:hypothetical protein D0466_04510 [Peribacillus glennii]